MKKINDLKVRVNELIVLAESARNKGETDDRIHEECAQVYSSGLSFIEKLYGNKHSFYHAFIDGWNKQISYRNVYDIERALGVLRAVKAEIDGGWLFTIKSLITAEVFSDFLAMADYLLAEGYKDATAVIVGSSLEGHIKQLCLRNDIPIERLNSNEKIVYLKAEVLNAELTKKEVYNGMLQKQVTAWLGLRNEAAHGNYDKYTHEQVRLMSEGVKSFIALNPA